MQKDASQSLARMRDDVLVSMSVEKLRSGTRTRRMFQRVLTRPRMKSD